MNECRDEVSGRVGGSVAVRWRLAVAVVVAAYGGGGAGGVRW